MPTNVDETISARFELPYELERSSAGQVVTLELYRGGRLVTASAATLEILRPDGSQFALLSTAGGSPAVEVGGSSWTARATIPDTSAESLGARWVWIWRPVVDGVSRTYRNTGALVLSVLSPPISEVDLYGRLESLDPTGRAPISRRTSYARQIRDAWVWLCGELYRREERPWMILEPSALREVMIERTLALIFDEAASSGSPTALEFAAARRSAALRALEALSYRVDRGDDHRADERRDKPGRASVWLGGSRRNTSWDRGW